MRNISNYVKYFPQELYLDTTQLLKLTESSLKEVSEGKHDISTMLPVNVSSNILPTWGAYKNKVESCAEKYSKRDTYMDDSGEYVERYSVWSLYILDTF